MFNNVPDFVKNSEYSNLLNICEEYKDSALQEYCAKISKGYTDFNEVDFWLIQQLMNKYVEDNLDRLNIIRQFKQKLIKGDIVNSRFGKMIELTGISFNAIPNFLPDIATKHEVTDDWYINNYEPIMKDQYQKCLQELINDKDSRHAVICMTDQNNFYAPDTLQSGICTIEMMYRLVDNKLNLIVFMRSNDICEYPCDYKWQMKIKQRMIEDLSNHYNIQIRNGITRWCAGSFHIYEKDWKYLT